MHNSIGPCYCRPIIIVKEVQVGVKLHLDKIQEYYSN